jgi:hypothetical protein
MPKPVTITLPTVASTGRRMPVSAQTMDGDVTFVDVPSKPCPGCQTVTDPGDVIMKLDWRWWHVECAARRLTTISPREAWIALGRSLAERPSNFKTTETRAIVENLLRLVDRVSADDAVDADHDELVEL